ncbi:MAG: FAD-linked oxidase C-terminal domain-containing protein [Desulfonauticus sp.]|nr:FAD-linked oxidase C-terminal domain-containing protein [Desulfonauticus sp.]
MPLTRSQKKFLNNLFQEEEIFWDKPSLITYGTDSSIAKGRPDVVVVPGKVSQIQQLLSFAQNEDIPVIPRGRGTGRAGGCVPVKGGIVVSLLRLNKILEIRDKDFVAIVEPGVITGYFQKILSQKKLFYPPDPASASFSTLGGNVATNAGGMQALKYGVTGNYILGLEVVLAGGKILRLNNLCHKNACGLNLAPLFVGSEGTLGIINKIYVKLLPLPESSASLLAGFTSLAKASDFIQNLFQLGIVPCALEIIGPTCIRALSAITTLPFPEARAFLLLKFDGTKSSVEDHLNLTQTRLRADFYLTATKERQAYLWEIRKKISPAAFKLRPNKLSEDFTVPRGKIRAFLSFGEELAARFKLPILMFGHVGDGNIHTNIMYDAKNKEELALAKEIHFLLLKKVLELQGTITGEHGIGLLKKKYVDLQLDLPHRTIMAKLKNTLDPKNILNPGKAF